MVADLILVRMLILLGFRNAQLDQIRDLEKRLPGFAWYGVGRNDGQEAGEFCPVFHRRDRFELLREETHWLSETPDTPGSKGWDTAITRLVTIVQLRDRQSNVKFSMLNTHLDHMGEMVRQNGAALIRRYVGQLDAQLPVVVTGDFNVRLSRSPIRSWPLTTTSSRLPTWSIQDPSPSNQRLAPTQLGMGFAKIVPLRRIDFIFTRPGMTVRRHRTLDDCVEGRFPSDHLPVVAELGVSALADNMRMVHACSKSEIRSTKYETNSNDRNANDRNG